MEITLFNKNMNQDNSIFEMFNPEDNDSFLNMSERELKEFLQLLERYKIFYRDKLNINSKNTFGTEIECVKSNIIKIVKLLREDPAFDNWKYKNDLSLPNEKEIINIDGVEYVITSKEYITDVLDNNKWKNLYDGCYIISNNAMIDKCCGGHIHIGSQILGRKKQNWLDFFLLWSAYEDVAYRFSTGNDDSFRLGGEKYALPISNIWQERLRRVSSNLPFERLINVFGDKKNNAVNLEHVDTINPCDVHYGNTLEFRLFNGCYDPIIIQNNINFAIHLMEYAASKDFDPMKSFYRKEELKEDLLLTAPKQILSFYNNIDLFKSMELADMIFSNNLDKINFLKQCIKSMDCLTNGEDNAKKLIK